MPTIRQLQYRNVRDVTGFVKDALIRWMEGCLSDAGFKPVPIIVHGHTAKRPDRTHLSLLPYRLGPEPKLVENGLSQGLIRLNERLPRPTDDTHKQTGRNRPTRGLIPPTQGNPKGDFPFVPLEWQEMGEALCDAMVCLYAHLNGKSINKEGVIAGESTNSMPEIGLGQPIPDRRLPTALRRWYEAANEKVQQERRQRQDSLAGRGKVSPPSPRSRAFEKALNGEASSIPWEEFDTANMGSIDDEGWLGRFVDDAAKTTVPAGLGGEEPQGGLYRLPFLWWQPGYTLGLHYMMMAGGVTRGHDAAADRSRALQMMAVLTTAIQRERTIVVQVPSFPVEESFDTYLLALWGALDECPMKANFDCDTGSCACSTMRQALARCRWGIHQPRELELALDPLHDLDLRDLSLLVQAFHLPMQPALNLRLRIRMGQGPVVGGHVVEAVRTVVQLPSKHQDAASEQIFTNPPEPKKQRNGDNR